jgi:hypothetical protein
MVQPLKHRHNTRQQLIIDTVNKFKELYPEEYKATCQEVREKKKKLYDKKYALAKDEKVKYEGFGMRATGKIPVRLAVLFDKLFIDPRFGETKKEREWFFKNFPEFKIPEKL